MTTQAISLNEANPRVVNHAIRELQQGRSNAHGSLTLAVSPATSTAVTAPTCGAGSHVSITPTTANASAVTGIYIVAANGTFTVNHDATADADCTFTFGIQG